MVHCKPIAASVRFGKHQAHCSTVTPVQVGSAFYMQVQGIRRLRLPYLPAIEAHNLLVGKGLTLRGITEGDSIPDTFIPRLIALYQQGKFPFDKLIKTYSFDQINQAVEDSEKGVTVKPVIRIGEQ